MKNIFILANLCIQVDLRSISEEESTIYYIITHFFYQPKRKTSKTDIIISHKVNLTQRNSDV